MSSDASGTAAAGAAPPKYRRRRRLPIIIVVTILLAATGVIWFQALRPAEAQAAGCNRPGPAPTTAQTTTRQSTTRTSGQRSSGSPAASTTSSSVLGPTTLGSFTDKNTLAYTRPGSPSQIPVQVLNASSQRGMATQVTQQLRQAGFDGVREAANDPVYPALDLSCIGEIRYGDAGAAGARTLLLLMPCAQLVVDQRVDESVDFVIGDKYEFADLPKDVTDQLAQIARFWTPPAVIEGQTQQVTTNAPVPPLPTAACPA
ncbi:envelope integrity protein Cei [Nakamurella aerolata]|uniref:Envelope integrity protein Cei n=1 Tax=Nakamurella aerolata TaxID=1656892 RepID=A0A849ACW0_9ACTN|nr:envelope integrity protein Cei [Nakamurella aerolata]